MTATPAAPAGPVGAPVAPASRGKVSASWAGIVMILGAVIAGIGAFLPWEKLEIFDDGDPFGVIKVTGMKLSTEGQAADLNLTLGSGGKTVLGGAVIVLVTGLVIALRKGKLWASILGLLAGLSMVGVGASNFGAAESDAKELLKNAADSITIDATRDVGVLVVTVGAGLAVLGALIALIKRRPA